MSDLLSGLLEFFGRLHPLVLHLPIGFITFLAIVEAACCWPRFKEAAGARRLLVLLTVLSVLIATACGWVLSWSGDYAGGTLAWHKWLGTALVPLAVILQVLLHRRALGAYRLWLGVTLVLVVATGHHGGSLVRGSDYLFAVFRKLGNQNVASQPGEAGRPTATETTAYASLIQPIFNEYCISCHGVEKVKGKLRLDSAAHLFVGGDTGPALQPGAAAESLLIKRLHLPEDEDEHMPPGGKKQPSAHQIALLEWWINVGAPTNHTAKQLKFPEAR